MEPLFQSWFGKLANQRWATGLVLGVLLLCAYWPVLAFDYLYHDDWIHITGREASCAGSPMYEWSRVTGRLVGQYVLCGLFSVFRTPEESWRARLVVLIGIAAFAFLQSLYFQAVGIRRMTAVSLAFGTSVLPGMLVLGYWITAGSIVFALVASVGAALLTDASLRSVGNIAWRAALVAGACSLQVGALLIYQTQAMYFWTLVAVMLAVRLSSGLKAALRPLAIYTFVGAAPMACYLIWFKYLSGLGAALQVVEPSRGMMFTNLAASASWFFGAILPRAVSLWFFDLPHGFAQALLVVFILSLVLASVRMWWMARQQQNPTEGLLCAAYPLVIVALGLLAFSPMLVTNYRIGVFRSLIPLSSLIFLIGVIHLNMTLATRWPPAVKMCAAGAFVLGLSCLAANSLVSRMILPAAAEYSFARTSLLEAASNGRLVNVVQAIAPRRTQIFSTDEVDSLTVEFSQDVRPMIQVIRQLLGFQPGTVSSSLPGEPFERNGVLILDFSELSKSGLWRSVLWNEATKSTSPRGPVSRAPFNSPNLPTLLRSHHGYNLVAFRGRQYGVPQSLGPLSLVDWDGGRVDKLPGVVIGNTIEEVLAHLPNVEATAIEPSTPAPSKTIADPPALLRSHRGYNLVAFRGRMYGVPQSLGPLSLLDWDGGRVAKLPGVVIEDTLDQVLARLPK